MPLPSYETLDELIYVYADRLDRDEKNRKRIKKFYNDDDTFNNLMEKIIDKDYRRFQRHLTAVIQKSDRFFPSSWKIFSIILDIVLDEGDEIPPFDTLTRNFSSKNIMYHKWTFSWVHGDCTIISIFNRENELVYRF